MKSEDAEQRQAAAKQKAAALKEQIQSTRGSVAEDKEAQQLAEEQVKEQEKAEKEQAKEQEKQAKEAAKSIGDLVKEEGIDALPPNFDYFIVGEYVRGRINEDGHSYTVVTTDGTAETVDAETFARDYQPVPAGKVPFIPTDEAKEAAKDKEAAKK